MVLLLGFKGIQKNKFLCGLSFLAMGGSWNNGAPQPYGENIKNSLNHEWRYQEGFIYLMIYSVKISNSVNLKIVGFTAM